MVLLVLIKGEHINTVGGQLLLENTTKVDKLRCSKPGLVPLRPTPPGAVQSPPAFAHTARLQARWAKGAPRHIMEEDSSSRQT